LMGVSLTTATHHATSSHKGTQIDLGFSVPLKLGAHATLCVVPGITWADQRYTRAFFGVTPEQSVASGFAPFSTQAGLKSSQLVLDFDMALSRHWYVNAMLQAKRLQRDAADSPIVQNTRQTSGMLAVRYQFQL
ncbi:MAG: MipA/OmpV family protein, partial [Cytophagales bacterium]|nr:MipA/OmpV family protein [Rhizobacter sp.]